jgi:UDP-glucose 4-epimerase
VRYLITGGAGFIGSTMARRLLQRGDDVLVLDDLSTGARDNLLGLEGPSLRFVEGCVLDAGLVDSMVARVDRVVHLAAAVGVHTIVDRPLHSLRTNLHGTEHVVDACGRYGVAVLVASTSEIYGKNTADGLAEDADRIYGPPDRSRWSYAEAKALDELVTFEIAKASGIDAVVVRPFNTVGPRQTGRYGMVVPTFVAQALAGEPVTVYGDGTQRRCFLHVEDLVTGMLALLDEPRARGRSFNLGGDEEIAIRALAERVIDMVGSTSTVATVPYDQAYAPGFEDMERRVPDTTRARELLGWAPSRNLDEILGSVIDHARAALAGEIDLTDRARADTVPV